MGNGITGANRTPRRCQPEVETRRRRADTGAGQARDHVDGQLEHRHRAEVARRERSGVDRQQPDRSGRGGELREAVDDRVADQAAPRGGAGRGRSSALRRHPAPSSTTAPELDSRLRHAGRAQTRRLSDRERERDAAHEMRGERVAQRRARDQEGDQRHGEPARGHPPVGRPRSRRRRQAPERQQRRRQQPPVREQPERAHLGEDFDEDVVGRARGRRHDATVVWRERADPHAEHRTLRRHRQSLAPDAESQVERHVVQSAPTPCDRGSSWA